MTNREAIDLIRGAAFYLTSASSALGGFSDDEATSIGADAATKSEQLQRRAAAIPENDDDYTADAPA